MLVSLKELGKYVDISGLSAVDIANKLTFAGIEVEEVRKLSEASNIVVGQVIKCETHPRSDHLHLVKVDVKNEILDIVCGAPNVRVGLKVIVALVGAKLPNGEIKDSVIRDYPSHGMLCSLFELGVDKKYLKEEQVNGIEELDDSFSVGDTNILEKYGLDDTILDLNLLANRSDCYALFNVAKEVGALFNRKINIPTVEDDHTYIDSEFKVDSLTSKCPLFSIKIVKGVKIKESPSWLKNILRNEGIRSINNIVDLGNYIMLLTGQPLHMYDLDKIPKKELIVRDDISENYVALDGKSYGILKNDLVVTSDNKVMCIAGIMGGENSEVSNETKNIGIEVASFNHASIRKTSLRLGLSSDSSSRFIKDINEHQTDFVLNLTTNILKSISKYSSISSIIKFDMVNHSDFYIESSLEYINNRLGTELDLKTVEDTLSSLHFEFTRLDGNKFKVLVPKERIDIEGEADLSEEIIRFVGFDNIKSTLPFMETTVGGLSLNEKKSKEISRFLTNIGLYRVISYTLIDSKKRDLFNFLNKSENYVIKNPLTSDHEYVRTNILSSLVDTVLYNLNHQNKNFGLYEISDIDSIKVNEKHLAICLSGKRLKQDNCVLADYSYFDVKGILDQILSMFNIASTRIKFERILDSKEFHPNRSAYVYLDNKLLAVIGEIHPKLKDELSLGKDSLVLLEMNLSLLFSTKSANNKFEAISLFPNSSRDYGFIVSKQVKFIDLKREIKKCSPLIKDVKLFDIYEGNVIKQNYVSLAINVVFEKKDSTLKLEEINEVDKKIWETLKLKFNVVQR